MMKAVYIVFILLSFGVQAELRERPVAWATPVIGSGLENLYKVDEGVFRSEQPKKNEFAELSIYGITDVLNLREFHDDNDEAAIFELNRHRVPIRTGSITQEQLIGALNIIQNREKAILVHCWHGSDRTGAVIAAYRIVFNNWSKQQAIDELANGGYGYHSSVYPNIIKLIEEMDVEKVKSRLGLEDKLKIISK
jgi:protein tyrosine/serine phosphatase